MPTVLSLRRCILRIERVTLAAAVFRQLPCYICTNSVSSVEWKTYIMRVKALSLVSSVKYGIEDNIGAQIIP